MATGIHLLIDIRSVIIVPITYFMVTIYVPLPKGLRLALNQHNRFSLNILPVFNWMQMQLRASRLT